MSTMVLGASVHWRLPAEWEPQECVWLVWPRDPTTWPDRRLAGAREAYGKAVLAIAPGQVRLVVHPEVLDSVPREVREAPHVHLVVAEHQDSWIRDYGPLTLVDDGGETRRLKFRFDAWGGKYEDLKADDDVVPRLVAAGEMDPVVAMDGVLEGGAVETDGQGTFLATRSVARGRGQTPREHERLLSRLGARKVLWLEDGIQGDDTDGHIDTITRFVAPGKVVTAVAPPDHPDHDSLQANRRALEEMRDVSGRRLEVLELPVPGPQVTEDERPLPAGYANFLITDHAVLVPSYDDPADDEAAAVLASCFPGRTIVPIGHQDLIWGFGGIHCLSMHVAKA